MKVRLAWLFFVALMAEGTAIASGRLAWFDGPRPTAQAVQAIGLLTDARNHGLDPDDYEVDALKEAILRAAQNPSTGPAGLERIDDRLTAAMERYLTDVHSGRLAPEQLPQGYAPPRRPAFDAAAYLQAALAAGRLSDAAREAAPRLSQYERLRAALAEYRALSGHPAWSVPLPQLPPGTGRTPPKLEPGQSYAGLPMLRERLVALGDLAPEAPATAGYDGPLVDAIMSFQQRHGLTTDGVVGKATLAHLQVPPAARARQIELMLERLRWTPLMQESRMIAINIPEFTLRAYEVQGAHIVVRATMKIIVGKAMNTRTPLFVEQMRFIEFQPYWNVPPSIARGEVVPRLRRDPAYFDREGFEFVTAPGQVVTGLSADMLDAVLAGAARIRQRPGPRNALGDIKFVFPNRDNIYLHHTPSVQLFARDRRDFSHGCIRVEEPVALAMFVLQDMPQWTEERIRQAMTQGEPSTLRLSRALPVLITYGTAIFKEGRMHFFDDIYGHDRRLDAALRRPRPALPPTER